MASKILPQALLTIPINPSPQSSPARRLTFSTYRSAKFPSCTSVSRVSSYGFSPNSTPLSELVAAFSRHSLVARAEADGSDGAASGDESAEVVAESSESIEGTAVEVEGEAEEAEVERKPRQSRVKLGDVMGILNKRAIEASVERRPIPDIRTGDVVEIKLEVPRNRRRLSIYKGIVISRQNAGIHTTIRIRRIIAGIGVEIVFPLYSPSIREIKVLKHRKVRRARLYYLRDKLPRFSTFK
ncbi:50S ribosomal protein L19, chloroplastic [Linum perenne]